MKPKSLFVLQACALAVFLAGVLMSIDAIRQNLELRGKIRDKIETLARLDAVKQARDRHRAALRVFEGLSNAAPVALASLSRGITTNVTPEIRERASRKLAAGWTLWQMEVVFNGVNLGQAPVFLQAAAMQRPPWRLVECSLASSRQADGVGRAVLVLEAVGKGGGQRTDDSLKRTPDAGHQIPDARGQKSEVSGQQPAVLPTSNFE